MSDEDEVLEVMTIGSPESAFIQLGVQLALIRNRGSYLAGRISLDEFEAELERLMRKQHAFAPHA